MVNIFIIIYFNSTNYKVNFNINDFKMNLVDKSYMKMYNPISYALCTK